MIIRKTFPQVYAFESPKTGKYWLVSARSAKWGLNQRKIFSGEELALKYARDLEAQVVQNGKQSDIPKEKLQLAASYEKLVAKLSGYGRTPEEAVISGRCRSWHIKASAITAESAMDSVEPIERRERDVAVPGASGRTVAQG